MNNEDFVSKAGSGVSMLNKLIMEKRKVYIHCSAGIYRSPQMIVLYLALFEYYPVDKALNVVK